MPVKHTLYVAKFTPKEVEVPDRCPTCGADFGEESALTEWNWNDAGVPSHVRDDRPGREIEADGEGGNRHGEDFFPFSLVCGNCTATVPWTLDAEDAPPDPASFSFRAKPAGMHVVVRVFAGQRGLTRGHTGHLAFRREEWDAFKRLVLVPGVAGPEVEIEEEVG